MRPMDKTDFIALMIGCAFIGINRFQPWEITNPEAVFNVGIALAIFPIARLLFKGVG